MEKATPPFACALPVLVQGDKPQPTGIYCLPKSLCAASLYLNPNFDFGFSSVLPRNFLSAYKVASLPFRFKSGGDGKMPASVMSHSHRPTTKSSHKPFKSKHATKSSLRNAAKGS